MRRIKTGLVLATALVMGLSLFGCGSKKTEENVTTTEAKAEVDVSQADMMKSATAVDETYHEEYIMILQASGTPTERKSTEDRSL